MTDQPVAIRATFTDFRTVKTRKLVQLVFELPIEQADEALVVLGGVPRPDAERWVAIARLDAASVEKPAVPEKQRRPFCELPMVEQAGIKCNDPAFVKWIDQSYGERFYYGETEEIVRGICGVASRRELLPGTPAGDRWVALLREFEGGNHG